jgi:hypothetical protein
VLLDAIDLSLSNIVMLLNAIDLLLSNTVMLLNAIDLSLSNPVMLLSAIATLPSKHPDSSTDQPYSEVTASCRS